MDKLVAARVAYESAELARRVALDALAKRLLVNPNVFLYDGACVWGVRRLAPPRRPRVAARRARARPRARAAVGAHGGRLRKTAQRRGGEGDTDSVGGGLGLL